MTNAVNRSNKKGLFDTNERVTSHCVKSIRIRSCSSQNAGKCGTRKTPNTDTFHAVSILKTVIMCSIMCSVLA